MLQNSLRGGTEWAAVERLTDVLRARRGLQRKSASPKGTQMQELHKCLQEGTWAGARWKDRRASSPPPPCLGWGCVPSQLWNPWPSCAGRCSKAQVKGEQVNTGFLQPWAREQLHFERETAQRGLDGPIPCNRAASHCSIVFIIKLLAANSLPSLQLCPFQVPEGSGKDLFVSELDTQPSGTEEKAYFSSSQPDFSVSLVIIHNSSAWKFLQTQARSTRLWGWPCKLPGWSSCLSRPFWERLKHPRTPFLTVAQECDPKPARTWYNSQQWDFLSCTGSCLCPLGSVCSSRVHFTAQPDSWVMHGVHKCSIELLEHVTDRKIIH